MTDYRIKIIWGIYRFVPEVRVSGAVAVVVPSVVIVHFVFMLNIRYHISRYYYYPCHKYYNHSYLPVIIVVAFAW